MEELSRVLIFFFLNRGEIFIKLSDSVDCSYDFTASWLRMCSLPLRHNEITLRLICEIHSPCKRHLTYFTDMETGIWVSHPGDLVLKCLNLGTSPLSDPTITCMLHLWHASTPQLIPANLFSCTHCCCCCCWQINAWESGKLIGSGKCCQDKTVCELCLHFLPPARIGGAISPYLFTTLYGLSGCCCPGLLLSATSGCRTG